MEFALLAPILLLSLLATIDLGLALYERMTIDHVLRAGAQSAMADQDVEAVRNVLRATGVKNFTLAGQATPAGTHALSLSVERYCSCPANKTVAVACSTTCSGPTATDIYYRLSATKGYDGLFLPITIGRFSLGAITLSSSTQVQIR